jgi:spore coat protein A
MQQISTLGLGWSARRCLGGQMEAMHGEMPGTAVPAQGGKPAAAKLPMLHTLELTPFVDPLPIPAHVRTGASGRLRIAMREVQVKVHRDVPSTRMWCYGDLAAAHSGAGAFAGVGPVIDARSGHPLQVEWVNQLPAKHFLPVDFSLHGCGHDVPEVRACVHLHGGRTPSQDDGQPEDWFVPGQSRVCRYPLRQDAATLWYHDHAMGLNRLNIYAGLLGMAIVRDGEEEALRLPSGRYEVPLIFFDRNFSTDGQLYYPESGDPERPWVSEFAGDGTLINGKIRPYFEVEPRPYRFRVLNGANSRFFSISLLDGRRFHQIGTDQGLLSAPVERTSLTLAPAERADLLIDFSEAAGQRIHLLNGAMEVLQFRVGRGAANPAQRAASVPAKLRGIARLPEPSATVTRTITLNEYLDRAGNSMLMLLNRKRWHEPVTETPRLGATEIWEFINLTEDTHPMHLHMVRFQVLDRRVFDVFAYRNNNGLRYLSEALPLPPEELGWKDIVQCPPGIVTRIIVKFEGYKGRYLYHCHILEHEANDMMRPFEVID